MKITRYVGSTSKRGWLSESIYETEIAKHAISCELRVFNTMRQIKRQQKANTL